MAANNDTYSLTNLMEIINKGEFDLLDTIDVNDLTSEKFTYIFSSIERQNYYNIKKFLQTDFCTGLLIKIQDVFPDGSALESYCILRKIFNPDITIESVEPQLNKRKAFIDNVKTLCIMASDGNDMTSSFTRSIEEFIYKLEQPMIKSVVRT